MTISPTSRRPVKFDRAQTLTADEYFLPVPDDDARVQAGLREEMRGDIGATLAEFPENANSHSSRRPIVEQADHLAVAQTRVVNIQRLLSASNEAGQRIARVQGAYQEAGTRRSVRLPRGVRLEQARGFPHERGSSRDNAEAAAAVDIEPREIERQDEQGAAVNNHHFAVVADEVGSGARHQNAGCQQTGFQFPKKTFAAAIGPGDQRAYHHSAVHRGNQRLLDLFSIETEDQNVDTRLRARNPFQEGFDSIAGLHY